MNLKAKSKKNTRENQRRSREAPKPTPFLDRRRMATGGIFFAFTSLVILVCFVGLSPAGPQVLKDQVSRVRVVAEFPFSYESEIETSRRREAERQRMPPVYRLDQEPLEEFRDYLTGLETAIDEYLEAPGVEEGQETASPMLTFTAEEAEDVLRTYDPGNRYNIDPETIATLVNNLSGERRNEVLSESLRLLGDIYRSGVYNRQDSPVAASVGDLSFFHIKRESGRVTPVQVQTQEDALRDLRINLAALNISRESFQALYRILRNGLEPNLIFDETQTEQLIASALEKIGPVDVGVREGETIIEPGSRVTALQLEQLNAYRKALASEQRTQIGIDELLLERSLLAILIVLAASLYLRVQNNNVAQQNRLLMLAGIVLLFNLAVIRFILEQGEGGLTDAKATFIALSPWLAPIALAPMIISILIGASAGIATAGLLAIFNALMQGSSIGILLASFLAGLVAVHNSRNLQMRARVVRAGFLSGLTMAGSALFLGLKNDLEIFVILQQMVAAIGIGAVTGVVVVGLLPLLEQLFRRTTAITLLELTDYNHPLLRRMQMEAPGSYHHSLMVANLAENASASINASPLVCRVCALFHDIGKTVKPEYFTENQNEGINPHIERNPSMSALIIKAHVKEGVTLARQYKLPQIIIDVIREHHGTSLIQYFYYKAIERQRRRDTTPIFSTAAPRIELDEVDEATYRYEGPKPHFKESAVIMLADSIEAASRSLKKVTPPAVEELIDRIVEDRIADGQLDHTELTLREIARIKESFAFTLLNMLHSRVEYPKGDGEKPSKSERGSEAPEEREEVEASKPAEARKGENRGPHIAALQRTRRSHA